MSQDVGLGVQKPTLIFTKEKMMTTSTQNAATAAKKIDLTPMMRVGHAMVNQAMGLDTGLTSDQLEHIYADLDDGEVCEEGNALLVKLLGADWNVRACDGCEQCGGCSEGEDEEFDDVDRSIAQVLRDAYDESETPEQVIRALSATLMNVAKESGMADVAITAHKIWFLH